MPFALDSGKDVWSRVEELRKSFTIRDTLLLRCQNYLNIEPTAWDIPGKTVHYRAGYGYIQAQAHLATVRVALPYNFRLAKFPDMSAEDRRRLENTEVLMKGLVEAVWHDQARAQRHTGPFDLASYAVHRGAIAARAYWKEAPDGAWKPKVETFDPKNVYFLSDDDGLVWVACRQVMPEAQLAAYADAMRAQATAKDPTTPLWQHGYSYGQATAKTWYTVWARDGGKVYWGVLGEAPTGSRSPQDPHVFVPLHQDARFTDIPIVYVPAGGRAALFYTGNLATFDDTRWEEVIRLGQIHHYGRPFYADMLEDATAINILTEQLLTAAMYLGLPPLQVKSETGTTSVEVVPGQNAMTTPDVAIEPIRAAEAAHLPTLTAEINRHVMLIEQKGLPAATLGFAPYPRSELLRQGLEEAGEMSIRPYRDAYQESLRLLALHLRTQLRGLFDAHDIKHIGVELSRRGRARGEPKREAHEYSDEDLRWEGDIECVLLPPDTTMMMARNMQIAALAAQQFPDIPHRYLAEELLGVEEPEALALEAMEESTNRELAPVRKLMNLKHDLKRLGEILADLHQGTSPMQLSEKDKNFLLSLVKTNQLVEFAFEEEDTGQLLDDIKVFSMFLGRMAQDLEQRLIPQNQAELQTQGATGGAPPPNPTMPPGTLPSQGAPAGRGFTGGGGMEDIMAAAMQAGAGSPPKENV